MMTTAIATKMSNHIPSDDLNLRAFHLPCSFMLDSLWGNLYLIIVVISSKHRRNLFVFKKRQRHALDSNPTLVVDAMELWTDRKRRFSLERKIKAVTK